MSLCKNMEKALPQYNFKLADVQYKFNLMFLCWKIIIKHEIQLDIIFLSFFIFVGAFCAFTWEQTAEKWQQTKGDRDG